MQEFFFVLYSKEKIFSSFTRMEIYNGSRRNQYTSKAQIKAVQEGGRRADIIRIASNEHHNSVEIPDAELLLDVELKRVEQTQTEKNIKTEEKPLSFWEQARSFFRYLMRQ